MISSLQNCWYLTAILLSSILIMSCTLPIDFDDSEQEDNREELKDVTSDSDQSDPADQEDNGADSEVVCTEGTLQCNGDLLMKCVNNSLSETTDCSEEGDGICSVGICGQSTTSCIVSFFDEFRECDDRTILTINDTCDGTGRCSGDFYPEQYEELIGWWSFDGIEGEVVSDLSTNGYHGNLIGEPTTTANSLIADQLTLNGFTQSAVIPNNNIDLRSGFSISAWIYPTKSSIDGAQREIASMWTIDGDGFDNSANWESHWPAIDEFQVTGGFQGGASDGRYLYFPSKRKNDQNNAILRYDTDGAFDDDSSWTLFDQFDTLDTEPDGFSGASFDGHYVYFIPLSFQEGYENKILRYNISEPFGDISSWEAYAPGNDIAGIELKYFSGSIFDGTHLYLIPLRRGGEGSFLRYDTRLPFAEDNSWSNFNPETLFENLGQFAGVVFDGQYFYAVPHCPIPDWDCTVIQYDTSSQDFTNSEAWKNFPIPQIGDDLYSYSGGAFDGRFVYFTPNKGTDYHSNLLQYDTTMEFSDTLAWDLFNFGEASGRDLAGFFGATFDGRFLDLIPHRNDDGKILRYDVLADFKSATSYTSLDLAQLFGSENPNAAGYFNAVLSRGYSYLVPYKAENYHAQMARLNRKEPGMSFRLSYSQVSQSGADAGGPFGPAISIHVDDSRGGTIVHTVSSNKFLEPLSWYNITATYTAENLSLYIDGELENSRPVSGDIVNSGSDLMLGGLTTGQAFFAGSLDEVLLYRVGLSGEQVLTNYCKQRELAGMETLDRCE